MQERKTAAGSMSVCMIVKNEADLLARCLDSIKPAADEIIVVDTGSTDATVEIAREKGAKVICSEWRNDFAWSRNISIENASCEWILWLDADDVVPPQSIPVLLKLKAEKPDHVIGLTVKNQKPGNTGSEFVQARMFPNRKDLRFERRIHEQIMPGALRIGMTMQNRDAVIEHHGYADPETMKKKALRNVKLLIEDYNESTPDSVTTVEIADSYQLTGDLDLAQSWYEKTLAVPDCEKSTPSIAGHAHLGLGNIYNQREDLKNAQIHLEKAHQISPWRPDVLYSLAVCFDQMNEPAKAIDCLYRILSLEQKAGQVGVDFRASRIKAYMRLSRILTEQNRLTDAAKVVADSLSAEPDRPELYNSAGRFLIKSNRPMDALHTFEKSIMLVKQGNLDAYIGLCVIYCKAGMKQKALETLESLAEDFNGNPKFEAFRAYILEKPLSDDLSKTLDNIRREFFRVF